MTLRRLQKVTVLLLLMLCIVPIAFAAPTPPQIAVNHDTRECAEFICGDECAYCILPEGWEILGYSSDVECPSDYTMVEITPVWKPRASARCCTPDHSGSGGDCADVAINETTEQCGFAGNIIEKCGELPDGWEMHGKECPHTWVSDVDCHPEKAGGGTGMVLIYVLACLAIIGLFLVAVVAILWIKRKRQPL